MDWKDLLKEKDPNLFLALQSLLEEVKEYKDIYLKAKNPSIAQLWIALAILYKKHSKKKKKETIPKDLEEKF